MANDNVQVVIEAVSRARAGINTAVRELASFDRAVKDAGRSAQTLNSFIAEAGDSFKKFSSYAGLTVLGVVSGFGLMLKKGVEFNQTLESSAIGIAAVLRQFNPESFGSFDAALSKSKDLIEDLKLEARTTNASFEELVQGFSGSAAALSAAGVPIERQVKLLSLLAQAVKTVGLTDPRQISQEIRSLLNADVGPDSTVGRNFFGKTANEDIKRATEAGQLADFLEQKLSAVAEAQSKVGQTFAGAFSNLGDIISQNLGASTVGLFESLRDVALQLQDVFSDQRTTEGIRSIADGAAFLAEQIGNLLTLLPEFSEAFSIVINGPVIGFKILLAGIVAVREGMVALTDLLAGGIGKAVAFFSGQDAFGDQIRQSAVEDAKASVERAKKEIAEIFKPSQAPLEFLGPPAPFFRRDPKKVELDETRAIEQEELAVLKESVAHQEQVLRSSFDRREIDFEDYRAKRIELANQLAAAEQRALISSIGDDITVGARSKIDGDIERSQIRLNSKLLAIEDDTRRIREQSERQSLERISKSRAEAEDRYRRALEETDRLQRSGGITGVEALDRGEQAALELSSVYGKLIEQLKELRKLNPNLDGISDSIAGIQRADQDLKNRPLDLKTQPLDSRLRPGTFDARQDRPFSERFAQFNATDPETGGNNPAFLAQMEQFVVKLGSTADTVANIISGTLGNAIAGVSSGITGLVLGTQSWGEAMQNTRNAVISALIQIGVQQVAQFALSKAIQAAATAFGVSEASTLAAAYAPASAAVNTATYGTSSTVGLGITLAAIAAIVAALAAFAQGGYTGDGAKHEVAGIVHRGEFVVPAWKVAQLGRSHFEQYLDDGIPARYGGLTTGVRPAGYEDGGFAESAAAGSSAQPINIVMLSRQSEVDQYLKTAKGQTALVSALEGVVTQLGIRR